MLAVVVLLVGPYTEAKSRWLFRDNFESSPVDSQPAGCVALHKCLLLHPATPYYPSSRGKIHTGVIYGFLLWTDHECCDPAGVAGSLCPLRSGASHFMLLAPTEQDCSLSLQRKLPWHGRSCLQYYPPPPCWNGARRHPRMRPWVARAEARWRDATHGMTMPSPCGWRVQVGGARGGGGPATDPAHDRQA